jgi:U3 small nucleolar RNA-associated protein 14
MSNKLTIDDFVKDKDIEIIDYDMTDSKTHKLNAREEINQFISNKESRMNIQQDKTNFYEVVPKTKLESIINNILNKNNESADDKNKRLTFQHNFDTKMRRMKRIKSKSYRKVKRQLKKELDCEEDYEKLEKTLNIKNELENDEDEVTEDVVNEEIEDAPIFAFNENLDTEKQSEIVKLAFVNDMEENEEDFVKEKEDVINEEAPKIFETVLPGWGDWAGPGLKVVKTKFNTISDYKEGIDYKRRKDFGSSHVIVNEGNNEVVDKYKTKVPYGYTKEEYLNKLNMPVSKECNTSRVYRKILNKVVEAKRGENIEPFRYEPENL